MIASTISEETTAGVVVIGAGVAGLSAALTALEHGARPIVLEAAPESERGGNSAFSAGSFRIAYRGLDDILAVVPDLTPDEIANTEFGTYYDRYFEDLDRVTEGRADPDLADVLVRSSLDAGRWLTTHGVRFIPNYRSHGYKAGGKTRFRGGSTVVVSGGGSGLVTALYAALARAGVPILYDHRAIALERDGAGITAVRVRTPAGVSTIRTRSVVIAAGGFESSPEQRARYLGPGWDLAKVRGTRHNTGDALAMAIGIGAGTAGHWSGCHSVGWDLSAPEFGDPAIGVDYKKDSYQYAIMVNADGERFFDEGADIRTLTYARIGALVLRQPNQFAWQVFDAKVTPLLRKEYSIRKVTRVRAESLEALAAELHGVDAQRFLRTVADYNAAVATAIPFDPNVKDGRGTLGLPLPKSNWANTIDTPPFEAYAVTCGITFTFGGLRISPSAEVLDTAGLPIPGLFACGSTAGGLFYFNYPGGCGLVSATVFGRRAGHAAARHT